MTIRRLPEELVNRIAAGEVVERPASAVKELVENAIDAGARRIEVNLRDGGRALISVADDGCGMTAGEIALAIERHATSKLESGDLTGIATLGFRGEALPSIAAVSRMTVTSRPMGASEAFALTVEGGVKSAAKPAAHPFGTRVEVRDLFFATPARLKFLKTPRTESDHAADAVTRLAMAHPGIAVSFTSDLRQPLRFEAAAGDLWDARLKRLAQAMGRDFAENALRIEAAREGYKITGYIGLPTLNRATAASQYLFVNGRPVRDKLLLGSLRAAYQDLIPNGRHPMVALFFESEPGLVDVNVHPTKAEVRFRDAGVVRGLIVGALKHALASAGHRASTSVSTAALSKFTPGMSVPPPASPSLSARPRGLYEESARFQAPIAGLALAPAARPASPPAADVSRDYPLGAAKAQLHTTYIVAETEDGLVIVDQHAAHERLVYERLKAAFLAGDVPRQALLIPEVVELPEDSAARLAAHSDALSRFGLTLEAFGQGAVVVREIPAAVAGVDVKSLVRDIADELAEHDASASDSHGPTHAHGIEEHLLDACATRACHHSVRAGRVLSEPEMNALLRQMEETPHSGQCGHGRPTYVALKLSDIEKLFGRR
jgi:DNA mismatch repair protein MutL